MTWLARIGLTDEQLDALEIPDNYGWHSKVWTLFPQCARGEDRPFLFRVRSKSEEYTELLVLARQQPEPAEWVRSHGLEWRVAEVAEAFLAYNEYEFDLLANPTERDKTRDGWNGRPIKRRKFNVTGPNAQRDWLLRKAPVSGFEILNDPDDGLLMEAAPRRDYQFVRNGARGLHVGVRFRGRLRVKDRNAFGKTFIEGIGSGRGFGFGLLLLSPVA